jgi:ribosomal-protein-alanine N-acetyltransferase
VIVATTPRLELRVFTPADAPAITQLFSDPEVVRHVGDGSIPTPATIEATLRAYTEHHASHGWSFWAVQERASGAVIGDAGLWPLEDEGPEVELGYTLGRAWWGRGYATEAARACLDVARRLYLPQVVAVADRGNPASINVLSKLGMRRAGTRAAYGRPHAYFTIDLQAPAEQE